jgi:methylated-DNA-[protein]-cysteine S-methyltransferase
MTTHTCTYPSPLGEITAASCGGAIAGLWFTGQKYFPKNTADFTPAPEARELRTLCMWLDGYFAGENPEITFALAPGGSEFRQEVWRILREIPYGETTTYGAIARRLAARRGIARFSAQAVGGAVGHNPISILIPCHRVVGADGSLTGYAGGVDKKQALLELEQSGVLRVQS